MLRWFFGSLTGDTCIDTQCHARKSLGRPATLLLYFVLKSNQIDTFDVNVYVQCKVRAGLLPLYYHIFETHLKVESLFILISVKHPATAPS